VRIIVVSAHYPPNFTSGGTLQPQRLARGLRGRGHDTSVFAGWLGDRPPLDTWDELDDTGLPVRWIATTPWTAWGDPLNHDNPAVTRAFMVHLAEEQPDIVHLHSIQTLGVGLVEAATAAGAKVVVTMHDFWWTCARQFLVDREYHPCAEVVELGVCECQAGRRSLAERTDRLDAALASADLVLAPSRSAAAILNANGVADGEVQVDENGLDALTDIVRVPTPAAGPVRFLFTGGPDPMKGWPVLQDAVAHLAGVDGWELHAYGFDDAAEATAGRVELHPPFAPEQADEVFGHADVLVIPSVMRESHSLVTREALARGLPVITSACVGPEEVVEDGVNGLVVPADDPMTLALALRRAIDDPTGLDAMRRAAPDVTIRSVADQVAGLERRYAELLDPGRPSATGARRTVRRVLFVAGIEGAPLRYRVRLPAEALEDVGVVSEARHFFDPELPVLAAGVDAVVLYRVPATTHVLATIDAAHAAGTPVLFDADDLIFDAAIADEIPALQILPAPEAALWLEGVHRYRTTLDRCDGFIGSTPTLVGAAERLTGLPAWLFANGAGRVLAARSDEVRRAGRPAGPPRLTYLSGTDTHDLDWAHLAPALAEVLDHHDDARLSLVGHIPEDDALARHLHRIDRLPFTHWLDLPEVLHAGSVNLAPLTPGSAFNEGKSAIKWLEAALVGTPTVASPTGPYRAAIDVGRTGLLADEPAEWVAALDRLLDDPLTARRMGDAARREVLVTLSPALQGRRYLDILEAAVARGPLGRQPDGPGVVVEEAPRPAVLEPYGDLSARAVRRQKDAELARQRAQALRQRTRRSLEEDGLARTAGRAARAAARRLFRR
jgi:glycosyltransferase involved in cell wall biosynthesis